ncbi:MAG: DUF642 domain-containing protein [Isosphaeraceae bacterium]
MRARKSIPLAAGLLFLMMAPIASHADLVTNGGFESPSVGSTGSMLISAGDGTLTGWTVGGNNVSLLGNTAAYQGTQCLALNNLQSNWISQDITTVAGTLYNFSIAYKAGVDTINSQSINPATGQVDVKNGSSVLLTKSLSTFTNSWQTYSGSFSAASTKTTILITGFFNLSATNLIIDGVSVNPAAVPEPGSLALGSIAIACLAACGRKRLRGARASA